MLKAAHHKRAPRSPTRRTTVTLPSSLLDKLSALARGRHQTLSSLVAQILERGIRQPNRTAAGADRFLERWRAAFDGLTEEEQLLVDGILPGGESGSRQRR